MFPAPPLPPGLGHRQPKNPRRYKPTLTIPGYKPDWDAILKGDSTYQGLLADQAAQHGLDVETRGGDIRRRLIEWGFIPEGLTDVYGDIDPSTRLLAQQATASGMSTMARRDRFHNQQLRSLRNNLAARGIYNQGAGGYAAGAGREQDRFTLERSADVQDLIDFLQGKADAYAAAEAQRGRDQAAGLDAAQDRALESGLDVEERAPVDLALVEGTGGFYTDKAGKVYDQNMKPVDVAKATAHYEQMVAAARRRGMPQSQLRDSWFFRRLQTLRGKLHGGGGATVF